MVVVADREASHRGPKVTSKACEQTQVESSLLQGSEEQSRAQGL